MQGYASVRLSLQFQSLRTSDAYLRQQNIPPLLQIMACRLFEAMSLPEAMLSYCHQTIRNKFQWKIFVQRNDLKMTSVKWRLFSLGPEVSKYQSSFRVRSDNISAFILIQCIPDWSRNRIDKYMFVGDYLTYIWIVSLQQFVESKAHSIRKELHTTYEVYISGRSVRTTWKLCTYIDYFRHKYQSWQECTHVTKHDILLAGETSTTGVDAMHPITNGQ